MHVVYFNCNWIGFLSSECFLSLSVTSRNARGLNAYFITNLNESLITCPMITDFHLHRFSFDLPWCFEKPNYCYVNLN